MSNQQDCNAGLTVLSFLAGAVTGAAVALLVTPKTGKETRDLLAGYGEEFKQKFPEVPESLKDQANKAITQGKSLVEQGKELIEKGNSLACQGKEYLESKKKNLSAAIDAGKEAMVEEKENLDRALDEK